TLFPVGEEGGKMRSFQQAMDKKTVVAELPIFICPKCGNKTIFPVCENCGEKAKMLYFCEQCGDIEKPTCPHGNALHFKKQIIDINHYMSSAMSKLGIKVLPDLIKGVRGTSNKNHLPENLAKGILRAKHEIYVNKDGTTRYDMTELPITHFRSGEIGTSIAKMKELGYEKDIYGKELENPEQLLEIKPQDIILPGAQYSMDLPADEVLLRISHFVDEMLSTLYGLKPFYNFKTREDLIGTLVIGLAPHISAGIIGRVIGFSNTQGCFAHPLWHAAQRRDCDGDENCVILLMDALINFSRQYLPDKRGSRTMDSPLVLTSKIVPAEVDDMVQKLDVGSSYPLEFYEACEKYQMPGTVKMDTLAGRLGTERQYEGMHFTHDVKSMNSGVTCSAYKTIPSMEEKLIGQMQLAEMIRAVNASDVARLVIEKHFMKDIKGNLRKFSMQQFRCVSCNAKYRRPPLSGICTKCGGKLIFTVSEGFVLKYLEPSISLAKKYNVPQYLKHSLELVKRRVEGVFGKDKEKQEGLGKWFG
ncbi:MAG: DNA polymerase II large subunit, partial [Candidatus Woesearchaeota archaeon]|nr:DNA polymerase II large subunit [Candidatus Woesearchaeota archaeon]